MPLDDGKVKLMASVQDTGVGIAPEDRERVFAPFEQAEEGQKREAGVGLGLAISRELGYLMGGDIVAEEAPGGGTLFRFTVAVPVLDQELVPAASERPILGYGGRRRRILVADDQEENRLLVRQMLEPVGFEVELASNGEEALAVASQRPPDLVVMDLRMPSLNGFGAAVQIRALPGQQGMPIIAASASSADLERAQADPSFALCLRKPFQAAELVPPATVLEELLDLARLGKLVRIEQRALELERSDPACATFAQRVYGLARRFEEDKLIALLQGCMGAQHDAVGQR
jgi:CheY-like chemotaxis protein